MKKLAFLLAFFFFVLQGFAGSTNTQVVGTIVDAETKKPITDASIIVTGSSIKGEQIFKTDDKGSFKISLPQEGTYSFKFVAEDYKTVRKKDVNIKTNPPTKLLIELDDEEGFGEKDDLLGLRFQLDY